MSRKIFLPRPEVRNFSCLPAPVRYARCSVVLSCPFVLGFLQLFHLGSCIFISSDDADQSLKLSKPCGCTVSTMDLSEARGLVLFRVVREGIGISQRLSASGTCAPTGDWDTHPRTRASQEPPASGELLQWLDDRGITPYIRVKEGPNSPPDLYGIEKFTYVPEENCYLCPAGKPLNYVGINKRNRAHRYYSTVKRCRGCGQKPQCTRGKFRTIAIHTCEAARQKADEVAKTPEFAVALRKRRKVEALFSELKNLIGLRRLRLRRIKFVREQFYLAAVAQNLKRLVRFLNMRAQPAMASA